MKDVVIAPWSDEQIAKLTKVQQLGFAHPYTCGNCKDRPSLIPTANGWICPQCSYTQNWVSSAVLDLDCEKMLPIFHGKPKSE